MSLVFGGAGLCSCCCFRDCDSHPSFRSTSVLVCSSWKYVVCSWVHFPKSRERRMAVVSCYNYAWFSSVSTVLSRLWTVRCVVLMARSTDGRSFSWYRFFSIAFGPWPLSQFSISHVRIFHHVIRGSLLVLYNDHTRRLEAVCPSDLGCRMMKFHGWPSTSIVHCSIIFFIVVHHAVFPTHSLLLHDIKLTAILCTQRFTFTVSAVRNGDKQRKVYWSYLHTAAMKIPRLLPPLSRLFVSEYQDLLKQ
jgi:hypothetical protein